MNHDDERDLFRRLENDIHTTTTGGGEVVDLGTYRTGKTEDPATPDTPVLVDPPAVSGPGLVERIRNATWRPVLPAWLRSLDELRDAARWVVRFYTHTTGYHTVRIPYYAGKLALRAPRGTGRTMTGLFRWMFDAEGAPVRADAVRRADAKDYLALTRERNGRVRLRLAVAVTSAIVGVPTALILAVASPTWALWATGAGLALALGAVGRIPDKPVVGHAVVTSVAPVLTCDAIVRALKALGNAEINKKDADIGFPDPIHRDGPGWRAHVDLPLGVTPADIAEKRTELASGLRRPVGCVWPEADPRQHAGRLILWVGDADLSQSRQPDWPLLRRGQVDLFKPVPFGTDQRGRVVTVDLMYANVLIGAMSGMGKSFSLRVLVLAACLDPRAEMWLYNLKGTNDFADVEPICRTYATGMDDATIAKALDGLRALDAELERRSKVIGRLPRHLCPQSKVTPELAARDDLGLHPLVMTIDECQELFSHSEYGKEAGERAVRIIRLGRALGIILLLATQRPDKDALPTGVTANVGIRFCLRVMGQTENDMILGTSSYKNGHKATVFTGTDRGIGLLKGATPEPAVVRSYFLEGEEAEKIALRALALRGGVVAPVVPIRPEVASTLLDDIAAVLAPTDKRVWSETVIERLAELRPDGYGGWDPRTLAAALAPLGVDTKSIGRTRAGQKITRRGIDRADILTAITERNQKRDAG